MSNYCPSCGAKVDEGYKFCLSCGAQLKPENVSNDQTFQESTLQQPTTQQDYAASDQPRSNKNLLFALIAIIAIIIIIAIIFILTGGGVIDNRFVGKWEQTDNGMMTIDWVFHSDGSLTMTVTGIDMDIANWRVKGNQLCLNMKENELWDGYLPEGFEDEICYDFVFSNGGNTVSLSIEGSENFVLTKK